jgi:predicted AlkP superfamily pyrophosphatase or phosphodiesterase
MHYPDYKGGSIVNLMASIMAARGGTASPYPALALLEPYPLTHVTNLILIVIDGLGYAYLNRKGRQSALRRHLKGRITTVFPTTTASAITTFLTGTAPQQHALTGWFVYFKELDRVATVLPFTDRRNGTSLAQAGIDAAGLFKHVPVFDRLTMPSYVVVSNRIAFSAFNLTHRGNATIRPYPSLSKFYKTIERIVHETNQPKYIYAYWSELDRIAHEHGIASNAATAHFAELDAAFDAFLTRLKGTDTTVIVTADHGMIDSNSTSLTELDKQSELVTMLAQPLCGERRAAYCYVNESQRHRFEAYIAAHLSNRAWLFKSEDLITQGLFGTGQPHPHLKERIGDYTLIMKENYTIKDWLPGEHRHSHIGTHGGLSREELYVPLIVASV